MPSHSDDKQKGMELNQSKDERSHGCIEITAVSAESANDLTPLGIAISTDLTKLGLKEKLPALVPRYAAEVYIYREKQ